MSRGRGKRKSSGIGRRTNNAARLRIVRSQESNEVRTQRQERNMSQNSARREAMSAEVVRLSV